MREVKGHFGNMHFEQAVMQQMTGNVEWQIGTRPVVDCGMGWGNQGMIPLEFGCNISLIQESTVKDNSSVVIW